MPPPLSLSLSLSLTLSFTLSLYIYISLSVSLSFAFSFEFLFFACLSCSFIIIYSIIFCHVTYFKYFYFGTTKLRHCLILAVLRHIWVIVKGSFFNRAKSLFSVTCSLLTKTDGELRTVSASGRILIEMELKWAMLNFLDRQQLYSNDTLHVTHTRHYTQIMCTMFGINITLIKIKIHSTHNNWQTFNLKFSCCLKL